MIYLDNGATSLHKPPSVIRAVNWAMQSCANPGRGGYPAAMQAAQAVFACRTAASRLFGCDPEQVVMTANCTHGLNLAIHSIVKPGMKVAVSGFEHNAVMRPLYARGARVLIAGRKVFDWEDTLSGFEKALDEGAEAAVFTHVSNVFGYILPVEELAKLCKNRGIPFILDAAQSAGTLPVNLQNLGAAFIAMPGHKGLLGPQGTGLLLCAEETVPLLYGGTGSASMSHAMPPELPERLEAGTVNVPGIAGLTQGLRYLLETGIGNIYEREHRQLQRCIHGLKALGWDVFSGQHQASTVSCRPGMDCEEAAGLLGQQGIAVRAGLHCAPLAHESCGTLETGTLRISYGFDANDTDTDGFLRAASKITRFRK